MWITFGLPWGWIHDQSVKKVTAVPGDQALPKLPQLAVGDREDDVQSLYGQQKKEVARCRYKS